MARKSKLLAALDAQQGRDHNLEKQKKFQKQAVKRKKAHPQTSNKTAAEIQAEGGAQVDVPANGVEHHSELDSEGWESDASQDTSFPTVDLAGINDSDSESGSSLDYPPSHVDQNTLDHDGAEQEEKDGKANEQDESQDENSDEDQDEGEDEDAIPFSDIESLSSGERADVVPHQRLTINNTAALLRALKRIALPLSSMPFAEHQTLTAPEPIPIPDINDDLTRELAFYKQCLDAATRGRALLVQEGVPFSRPADYFAEMVKTDEHMGLIRQKMTDEAAGKRAAAEARKQRDLKRFGKQVQVAKLQERDKAKRETLDKINLLKRKRRNTEPTTANEDELFDVALETNTNTNTNTNNTPSRSRSSARNNANANGNGNSERNSKRQKKDTKFGFGGKKRFAKSGDAVSSGDLRGFSARGMKEGGNMRGGGQHRGTKRAGGGPGGAQRTQRLGKSRRAKRS